MADSAMMGPAPVLRQESWTIKRSENILNQSTSGLATSISESVDPISELDKRFPGFKKGPGYQKLEK